MFGCHSRFGWKKLTCSCLLTLFAAADALTAPPASVELYGVVRDFTKDHPDFDVDPIDGLGHYAGNIDLTLGSGYRPTFVGGGFKVASQWRDAATQPIAPHMFVAGGGGPGVILLVNGPQIDNKPTLDTWDSSKGPYGGSNIGPPPSFETGAEMPVVTVPTGLPWIDFVKCDGKGTSVLSSSVHCNKFELINNHTLQISGSVVIVAEELFKVTNHCDVELLPGASLEVYALKDCEITNNVEFNVVSGDPSAVTIYYLGVGEFKLSNNVDVYAQIVAPFGKLLIENDGDNLYGGYIGKDFHIKNSAGFHADTSDGGSATVVCGVALNDSAGSPFVASNGAIASADSFQQWYRDILGVNVSRTHSITLTNNAGVYEYIDNAFYPLDDQAYGNEGDAHNNYFTYAIDAEFTYEACAGQFVEIMSVDDSWLFVNGQLVIDLGGVEPGTEQVIDLDRLNLVDGETYDFRLYCAHRRGATPALHVRTNVVLEDAPKIVSISIVFD